MSRLKFLILPIVAMTIFSCGPDKPEVPPTTAPPTPAKVQKKVPKFDSESAYNFIKTQIEFGPRVTNSPGHAECKKWLVETLNGYADNVIEQDFSAKAYTGTMLNGTNIIAQFNPEATNRICLAAHWDTRHIADSPLEKGEKYKPIDGADDGGSGVGVLLEIARTLKENPIELGVDLVLFDAEDHGEENSDEPKTNAELIASSNSWGLGSQYWASNLHVPGYNPKYAILLDMVGAKDARFPKEGWSMQVAPSLVNKVWKLGQGMGYTNYFSNEKGGSITDDHYFVIKNTNGRIRMIDIVNLPANQETTFGGHWHTHNDNLDVIDKRTLKAVGQVMLAVLYREENGTF